MGRSATRHAEPAGSVTTCNALTAPLGALALSPLIPAAAPPTTTASLSRTSRPLGSKLWLAKSMR
eukprot:5383803-Prymnesium_polylepis.1